MKESVLERGWRREALKAYLQVRKCAVLEAENARTMEEVMSIAIDCGFEAVGFGLKANGVMVMAFARKAVTNE